MHPETFTIITQMDQTLRDYEQALRKQSSLEKENRILQDHINKMSIPKVTSGDSDTDELPPKSVSARIRALQNTKRGNEAL
jgi:hypothetical protein